MAERCLGPDAQRHVLGVEGTDAAAFLQGVLTQDVDSMAVGEAAAWAFLDRRGRVLAEGTMVRTAADAFLMELALSRFDAVIRSLLSLQLRSRLDIVARGDIGVHRIWNDTSAEAAPGRDASESNKAGETVRRPPETLAQYADPRHATLGWTLLVPKSKTTDHGGSLARNLQDARDESGWANRARADLSAWHEWLRIHGVPECSRDYQPGTLTPFDVNLDRLGAVALQKGCYLGQEIVSRIWHRDAIRTRTLPCRRVPALGIDPPREIEALTLAIDDHRIGTLNSYPASHHCLARVRLDHLFARCRPVTGPRFPFTANVQIAPAGGPRETVRFTAPVWWRSQRDEVCSRGK